MRIRICLPFYDRISDPTRAGIEECLEHKKLHWQIRAIQSSRITTARNRCLNDGISIAQKQPPAEGVDYFLFVDSDIGFRLSHVLALLAHKKDIVSGAYTLQGRPEDYAAGSWLNGFFGGEQITLTTDDHGLKKVEWIGAGFLLIHRSALNRISYPWFHESLVLFSDGSVTMPGEDQTFAQKAAEAGFVVWCDCDTRVRHIGRKPSQFNWDNLSAPVNE